MDANYWNECFTYDPATGLLAWKDRPMKHFRTAKGYALWRSRCYGKPVGSVDKLGYLKVSLKMASRSVHRIIFEMANGSIPEGIQIDHANGDPSDNRIANLRLATPSENQCNQKLSVRNKIGFKGVHWNKVNRRYAARIKIDGREIHLGSFDTAEAAYRAYTEAALHYHGDFARFA